jgi:hypothetical protein
MASVGEKRGVYRFLLGSPKVKNLWEDLDLGGSLTLNWSLLRQESMGRNGFSWFRTGSGGGLFEHIEEPSGSIKKAEHFLQAQ